MRYETWQEDLLTRKGLNSEDLDRMGWIRTYDQIHAPWVDFNKTHQGWIIRTETGYIKQGLAPKLGLMFGHQYLNNKEQYGKLFLVESPFDVIALAKLKKPSLAIMSSTLKWTQAVVALRYTRNIILMFDNDEAGKRGMLKAQDTLSEFPVGIEVCSFAGAESPADYLAKVAINKRGQNDHSAT